VLEEPPGNRSLDDEMVKQARARLFGSWEMNWMAYNFAHDVALPGSSGAPLAFLMYPQAETADGRLDCLDPGASSTRSRQERQAPPKNLRMPSSCRRSVRPGLAWFAGGRMPWKEIPDAVGSAACTSGS